MTQIQKFYQKFPLNLESNYRPPNAIKALQIQDDGCPKIWKTIGDEILFCCRVLTLEHLSACVEAFLKTLKEYGQILDKSGKHLDVKGAGWLAAFPAPNVTVHVSGRHGKTAIDPAQYVYITEEFETLADFAPGDFDFLTKLAPKDHPSTLQPRFLSSQSRSSFSRQLQCIQETSCGMLNALCMDIVHKQFIIIKSAKWSAQSAFQ